MSSSSQPVNLVSVNTAPERAKKVIGAVIEGVKDRYSIVHAGNSESEFWQEAHKFKKRSKGLAASRGRRGLR